MRLLNLFYSICLLLLLTNTALAKTVKFAVVSDVNYSTETDNGNKNYTDGAKALNGFIARSNENKYDFVIFLGDSINKSNQETLNSFLTQLNKLDAPYYLTMGDKDVHKISGLSKTEFTNIVAKYIKDDKCAESSYVFYPNKEIAVIVLDSVASGMPTTHGIITEKTLKWLDETLTINKTKKVVICQHVPYLTPYDKYSYSLLNKNEYYSVIKRHKNILMILSGHYQQDYVIKDEQNIYHITVSALKNSPYNYNEIEINYDKKTFSKAKNFTIDGNIKPAI